MENAVILLSCTGTEGGGAQLQTETQAAEFLICYLDIIVNVKDEERRITPILKLKAKGGKTVYPRIPIWVSGLKLMAPFYCA